MTTRTSRQMTLEDSLNHELPTVYVTAGNIFPGPHGLYLVEFGWLRWRRPLPAGGPCTLRHLGTGDFLSATLAGNDILEALTPAALRRIDGTNQPDSAVIIASLVRQLERTQNERAMEKLPLEDHLRAGLEYLAQYDADDGDGLDVQRLAESLNRDLTAVMHTLGDLEARGTVRRRGDGFALRYP